MTDQNLPAPIQAFIDATNAADNEAFVATFTEDAYVRDYGREFTGHKGTADWNRTDNIGVNMKFDYVGFEQTAPGTYEVKLKATSNRFNGTGTLRITVRDNLISRLEIG
jgi:ketosteroid isomerase-like protein